MNLLFQQILAIVLVALAVGFTAVHYLRKKKSKGGCATCKVLEAVQKKSSGGYKAERAVK